MQFQVRCAEPYRLITQYEQGRAALRPKRGTAYVLYLQAGIG